MQAVIRKYVDLLVTQLLKNLEYFIEINGEKLYLKAYVYRFSWYLNIINNIEIKKGLRAFGLTIPGCRIIKLVYSCNYEGQFRWECLFVLQSLVFISINQL